MGDVKIIPYATFDGVPTFKDSDIIALWDQMVADGTIQFAMLDGGIKSAEEFLHRLKAGTDFLAVCYWKDELVGMGWVNTFQATIGQGHFCGFSNVWGDYEATRTTYKAGLDYCLDKLGLDMLYGFMPEKNKGAIKLSVDVGFVVQGSMPYGYLDAATGESGPTMILTYSKEGKKDEDNN